VFHSELKFESFLTNNSFLGVSIDLQIQLYCLLDSMLGSERTKKKKKTAKKKII